MYLFSRYLRLLGCAHAQTLLSLSIQRFFFFCEAEWNCFANNLPARWFVRGRSGCKALGPRDADRSLDWSHGREFMDHQPYNVDLAPRAGLKNAFNLLKPTAYVMDHSTIVRSAHTVFMCFVFIWEQTATCAAYIIKLIGFYNRDEKCLLRGTDWVFK